MLTTADKRRANGKKSNGKHSGLSRLSGSLKGQIPDIGLTMAYLCHMPGPGASSG